MNLRRRKPHDSLYMLLDTMCNAFGGIILLAVLVVLLTSKAKTQNADADSTRLLERRVALAQTNLQQSLQLAAALHAQAGDPRWKTQVSLLAERQQLDEKLKAIRELAAKNAEEIDANASSDPSDRLKKLDAQLTDGEVKKLEEQNKIDASKEEKKRVATQLDVLEKKMDEVVKRSQQELRLPKEHNTERQAVYIIVIYGRVYFCHNVDMTRNETDIKWSDRGGVEYSDPRKAKGLDPVANAAQIRTYFTAQAHNSVYVVFLTLADSFPAFIRAKQLAVECGLPYGWMPWDVSLDGPLCFSTSGYSPSPQ
ncbi:MAG TPA: hypothetical protein VH597_16765 [Verrucomicrobiae bacterium]|jgi:hypothetical protein|nr:hypothetical protein [Verrucomicrobiae bacterium]